MLLPCTHAIEGAGGTSLMAAAQGGHAATCRILLAKPSQGATGGDGVSGGGGAGSGGSERGDGLRGRPTSFANRLEEQQSLGKEADAATRNGADMGSGGIDDSDSTDAAEAGATPGNGVQGVEHPPRLYSDVNAYSTNGWTALMEACTAGNVRTLSTDNRASRCTPNRCLRPVCACSTVVQYSRIATALSVLIFLRGLHSRARSELRFTPPLPCVWLLRSRVVYGFTKGRYDQFAAGLWRLYSTDRQRWKSGSRPLTFGVQSHDGQSIVGKAVSAARCTAASQRRVPQCNSL